MNHSDMNKVNSKSDYTDWPNTFENTLMHFAIFLGGTIRQIGIKNTRRIFKLFSPVRNTF